MWSLNCIRRDLYRGAACWHMCCGRQLASVCLGLLPLPGCTRWKGGTRGLGLLTLLLLYVRGQKSQVEVFLPREMMAMCSHYPESFVAGEGKEKLRVSSQGQLMVLAPSEDGQVEDCFHLSSSVT